MSKSKPLSLDESRRIGMQILEKEAGGPSKAAEICRMTPAQWTNIRSGFPISEDGALTGMRSRTARRIEAAFDRPAGWLDAADLTTSIQISDNYIAEGDKKLGLVMRAWVSGGREARTALMSVAILSLGTPNTTGE